MDPAVLPIPGPKLEINIKKAALMLAKKEKRDADALVQKLLASNRDMVAFLDPADVWHPYFLTVLAELRSDEARRDELAEHLKLSKASEAGQSAAAAGAAQVAAAAAANKAKAEELRAAAASAKQHTVDPCPPLHRLQLAVGVEVPALMMDVMKVTAQFAAKFASTNFLETVARKQRLNNTFRFLHAEDPRHASFCGLVQAYRAVLEASEADTEERLERLVSEKFVVALAAEKTAYQKANVARKKAALLTDDELRRRLDWDYFVVVHTFDYSDLGVAKPTPVAPAAAVAVVPGAPVIATSNNSFIAPPAGSANFVAPPSGRAQQVFMSSALLSGKTGDAPKRGPPPAVAAAVVDDSYQVTHTAPQRGAAITMYHDSSSGQLVPAAHLNQHMSVAGSNMDAHAAERELERKRQREGNNLASDAEYERNMQLRQQRLERV
jgi:hypothetical protein